MIWMSLKSARRFLSAGLLFVFLTIVGLNIFGQKNLFLFQAGYVLPASWIAAEPSKNSTSADMCDDVLNKLLTGRWHQNKMTPTEVETMKRFHRRVRQEEHHVPKGGQRADKKCGNVSVGTGGTLSWFRALCDPDGQVPCCSNNQCVNKTVKQCECTNCFDMRTPIHAEYATWRPADPVCEEPESMSVEEICALLGKSTLHFIGDSLVRHVYTAFLLAVTGNDKSGAFRVNIPQNLRSRCEGIYMFTEKVCRLWLAAHTTVCEGKVALRFDAFYQYTHHRQIQKAVSEYAGKKIRSFVFLGLGFHDNLNFDKVTALVLKPLLTSMKNLRWPRLLWASIHKFGLMRTPLTATTAQAAKRYNRKMETFLADWQVPVFDTFNLTDNVMSFDGQHYGFGINRMKVRILLRYIQQLKQQGLW